MSKNDGGPAFPYTPTDRSGQIGPSYDGMSLRDWFAGMILSYCAEDWRKFCKKDQCDFDPDLVARDAYELADAMLATRKRKGGA